MQILLFAIRGRQNLVFQRVAQTKSSYFVNPDGGGGVGGATIASTKNEQAQKSEINFEILEENCVWVLQG